MERDLIIKIAGYQNLLKSEIMFLNNNCLYGLNSYCIKLIDLGENTNESIITRLAFIMPYIEQSEINPSIKYSDIDVEMQNPIISSNMMNGSIARVNNILSYIHPNNFLYGSEDVKSDPSFTEILDKKSADGTSIYRIESNGKKFCMTMFKNLINVNKSDKVGLSIYSLNQYHFLAVFSVTKKKQVVYTYVIYKYM